MFSPSYDGEPTSTRMLGNIIKERSDVVVFGTGRNTGHINIKIGAIG